MYIFYFLFVHKFQLHFKFKKDNGDLRPSAENVAKLLDEIAHVGAIQDEKALAWWNTNFQDNNKVVVSQLLNSLECPENFNKKMYV